MAAMFNIKFLTSANKDFDNIYNFLQKDNGLKFFNKLVKDIKEKLIIAAKEPLLYPLDKNRNLAKDGVRYIPLKPYIIYFKADVLSNTIQVLYIRHEKQKRISR